MSDILTIILAGFITVSLVVSLMYVSDSRSRETINRSLYKGILKKKCSSLDCYVMKKSDRIVKSSEYTREIRGAKQSRNNIQKNVFFDNKKGNKLEFLLPHVTADLLNVGTYGELRYYKGLYVEFVEKEDPKSKDKNPYKIDKERY